MFKKPRGERLDAQQLARYSLYPANHAISRCPQGRLDATIRRFEFYTERFMLWQARGNPKEEFGYAGSHD